MLELKTKKELAGHAYTLATGYELVRFRNVTYIPADFETQDSSVLPPKDRTIWLPLSRADVRRMGAEQFDVLFATDSELSSFEFMVSQYAAQDHGKADSLLIRTEHGLQLLNDMGQLTPPTGRFVANTVMPMLNTDEAEKTRVFDVFSEWLDSDEEAESLLSHLATILSPGWSAVRYVLLLGEGRNGKSVLLKMVQALFGQHNVSNVTRQHIAEQSAVVTELNGKLVNLIYDGRAEYLKDSGTEKSLIAGEPAPIRKLYESTATMVQTNALFIEGLNREPKSSDKSGALQKRLVRFQFPNVYPLNHLFEKHMLSEVSLGAFLSLLVDRYVLEDEVAVRLQPTKKAVELQLDHMHTNSLGLQFLKYVEDTDPLGANALIDESMDTAVQQFQAWRVKQNDIATWAAPDVANLLTPLLETTRKSIREDGKIRKSRLITGFKRDGLDFLESLEGTDD